MKYVSVRVNARLFQLQNNAPEIGKGLLTHLHNCIRKLKSEFGPKFYRIPQKDNKNGFA